MPRQRQVIVSVIALLLLALAGVGLNARVGAQDAAATQGHPLVGTWRVDTDLEAADNALDSFLFTSDGTYVELDANGDAALGAWEATGENTANVTIVSSDSDDEGNSFGTFIIRASAEVAADGASFTADYTFEFIQPDGTSSGQAGPGQVTGERLVVEGPGTPVMTLEEMFASFEEEAGATPEA